MSIVNYGAIAVYKSGGQIWENYSAKLIVNDDAGVDFVNAKQVTFKSNPNISVNSGTNLFTEQTNQTIPVERSANAISFTEADGRKIKRLTMDVFNLNSGDEYAIYLSSPNGSLNNRYIVNRTWRTVIWTANNRDGDVAPTIYLECNGAGYMQINTMTVIVGRY